MDLPYYSDALKIRKRRRRGRRCRAGELLQDLRAVRGIGIKELATLITCGNSAEWGGDGINSGVEDATAGDRLGRRNVEYQFNWDMFMFGEDVGSGEGSLYAVKAGPDRASGSSGEAAIGRLRSRCRNMAYSAASGRKRGNGGRGEHSEAEAGSSSGGGGKAQDEDEEVMHAAKTGTRQAGGTTGSAAIMKGTS